MIVRDRGLSTAYEEGYRQTQGTASIAGRQRATAKGFTGPPQRVLVNGATALPVQGDGIKGYATVHGNLSLDLR